MWLCKHCKQIFEFTRTTDKANHSRHCVKNPNRKETYDAVASATRDRLNRDFGEYKRFLVKCHCCDNEFGVEEREKSFPSKEEYFCSRSCANSVGGRAKADKYHPDNVATYTAVAWRHHEKRCVVCGEERIVAVHHLNEDHDDNRPENLVPLCPTHHQYMHSRFKSLIDNSVNEYIKEKYGL